MEESAPQRTNWLALVAPGLAVVVIANDLTAVNVALPTMESDFDTNIDTIQWVIDAYALTFGVMIVTGGRLAEMFGRRNAFFVGTAIFAVVVTYFLVHVKEPEAEDRRIDHAGISVLSLGLVSLPVALDQVEDWGWRDPKILALLALAAAMIAAFLPIERRADPHAPVPREVMRNRSFTASCVAILLMSATFFASLLYLPQFMEKQFGYSPLESGIGLLPFLGGAALHRRCPGGLPPRRGASPGRAGGLDPLRRRHPLRADEDGRGSR